VVEKTEKFFLASVLSGKFNAVLKAVRRSISIFSSLLVANNVIIDEY
jgi:hypothetical protein